MKDKAKEQWKWCARCKIIFDIEDTYCPSCGRCEPEVGLVELTEKEILRKFRKRKIWTKHQWRFTSHNYKKEATSR